ncbi:MAG: saccharopine dehydrogenase C-terminal domain-containing protein [Bacteroidota bacterium]
MKHSKRILLFGAGKSATVLIDYLKDQSARKNWLLIVADNNLAAVQAKLGDNPNTQAIQINIENAGERKQLVADADIVISMMPPSLHFLIAVDCIEFSKNLLTASYTDSRIKELSSVIEEKGLLFLCEMGLDPGIDHMSAMKLIHVIEAKNGEIISFKSHCGGLVATENDDNPWHYKIRWNPRNVVLAGKAGALFKLNGESFEKPYSQIFDSKEQVTISGLGSLSYYPNRDSLSYIELYHLKNIQTFIRTTLRYPSFIAGWKKMIEWQLTDEDYVYQTKGLSIAKYYQIHFERVGLKDQISSIKNMASSDEHAASLIKQFEFLGLNDQQTILPFDQGSAADILQFILENKLALKPGEKDMVVMLHELEYIIGDKLHRIESSLVTIGSDEQRTAMAKTVGLPLGIAAVLILEGKIKEKGLHIPIKPTIYLPVMEALENESIRFTETHY